MAARGWPCPSASQPAIAIRPINAQENVRISYPSWNDSFWACVSRLSFPDHFTVVPNSFSIISPILRRHRRFDFRPGPAGQGARRHRLIKILDCLQDHFIRHFEDDDIV